MLVLESWLKHDRLLCVTYVIKCCLVLDYCLYQLEKVKEEFVHLFVVTLQEVTAPGLFLTFWLFTFSFCTD